MQHKHKRMYSLLSALRAENVETNGQDHGKWVAFFSDLEVESVVYSLQHCVRFLYGETATLRSSTITFQCYKEDNDILSSYPSAS